MQSAVPPLPWLYVWGDLLGETDRARCLRRLLPGLLAVLPGVEARRFWPLPADEPVEGREIPLSDGARTWSVRTLATPDELAAIGRAVAGTVPAGSPVLVLDDDHDDLGDLVRAWLPEAGPVVTVEPATCPQDGRALAENLAALLSLGAPVVRDVVLTAPVLGPSGYAAEGRVLFARLNERPDLRVCLRPLRFGPEPCGEDADFLRQVKKASGRQPRSEYDAIHLVFPPQLQPDPGARRNILRTMYETDHVPESWRPALALADELWVPSAFHVRSFTRAGIAPERIRVVPECLGPDFDPTHWRDVFEERRRAGGPMRFLSVFDWCRRKAPDVLLPCFGRVFRHGEAELHLKVHCSLGRPLAALKAQAEGLVAAGARAAGHDPPEVVFVDAMPAPSEMPGLYAAADAFVLASRGEGWGRPVHEAMAMGLPVVSTTFGGTQDLLGAKGVGYAVAGHLVDCPPEAVAEVPELAGGRWLEPDPDDLCRKLRAVFESREEARATGQRARRHVVRWFSRLEVPPEPRSPAEPSPRPLVVLEGPVFASSSYAGIQRHLARALRDRGNVDVRLLPSAEPLRDPRQDRDLFSLTEATSRRPDVCLRSGWPVSPAPPDAAAWIQRIDWEYGALPVELASLLSHGPDEIWVHSRAGRDTLLVAGIPESRTWIVPHGIDPERFHPGREPLTAVRDLCGGRFAFLFVGGTIWRKGIDLLLRAWLEAFRAEDPVCLLVKSAGRDPAYAGQGIEDLLHRVARTRRAPAVHVLDEELSDDDMALR